MKKSICTGAFALVLALAPAAVATNLTGTFKHPDGSLVNGKLILRLSQPAKLSDNSAQIVPIVKIFTVTSGQLEANAFVYGNDVLLPTGTHYVARLVDNNNNLLFEQKWSITGTALDLGSLTPTTIGLVLADPLVRNVVTSQVVQGPVTFSSPLTAFSITLNGNFNPGAPIAYDMGNPALPWRELYASRWNGDVQPGSAAGAITPPGNAPTVTVDTTSGGSLDNTPRYLRFTLITLNGETPASPVQTFTPSTCGGGACKFTVNVAGANDVVITMSAAVGSGRTIVGGAVSLTGAHQTSPLDAHNGNNVFDPGISVSVTTIADNCWVLDTAAGLATVTVGAGQTERWNVSDGTNQPAGSAGSTEGPKTPAGAVTMSWSGSDTRYAISAASYQPSTGAVAVARRRVSS